MKPHQGLFVLLIGVAISVISLAPLGLALFLTEAPPAVADTWAIGSTLLYFGIAWLILGLVVIIGGVLLTAIGVFTK